MRRRHGNQKGMFMLGVFAGLICVMTVGYAAFSTTLNIKVKGNIGSKDLTPADLTKEVVNEGDGLYIDTYEENRYVYKGANPDNYIKFNNETWRIIALEQDKENPDEYNLKIMKKDSIGSYSFDIANNRDSSVDTYCNDTSSGGCNAWAATAKLVGNPNIFTLYHPNNNSLIETAKLTGTVTKDSSLNTYLNETYFNNLNDKDHIIDGIFNVGSPGSHHDEEDWGANIKQEKSYNWKGKVGLITLSEYVRGSIGSTSCKSYKEGFDQNSDCSKNNWLYIGTWELTISPSTGNNDTNSVCNIRANGSITNSIPEIANNIRPVLYLSSDIKLLGEGTESNPYIIVD